MTELACPACGEPLMPSDRFCEGCGATLADLGINDDARGDDLEAVDPTVPGFGAGSPFAARCIDCGGPLTTTDGSTYCEACGRVQPSGRDHLEHDDGSAAGVTDRGLVHRRNEDAMAVHLDGASFAVVVCDGVSTSQRADEASQVAADTALGVLVDGLAPHGSSLDEVTLAAVHAAQDAVAALPWDRSAPLEPPSCTIVSAVRRPGGPVVVASIGDARAYWFAGDDGRRLSTDDSWAADAIAAGTDPVTAEADRRAHAITRWLGRDAPEPVPHLSTVAAGARGRLLVCSDGLWNYASAPAQLAAMVGRGTPIEAARQLTAFALDRGAHDNVTVVIVDVDPDADPDPAVALDGRAAGSADLDRTTSKETAS